MPAKETKTKMVSVLTRVLADTYVLAVKTHGYHWNVVGEDFLQHHDFFGKQYASLLEAADELAERIRALGAAAPAGMAMMLSASKIEEAPAKPQNVRGMLKDLVVSHQHMVTELTAAIEQADDVDDDGTEDMLIGRLQDHQKTLWMLRSMLGQ